MNSNLKPAARTGVNWMYPVASFQLSCTGTQVAAVQLVPTPPAKPYGAMPPGMVPSTSAGSHRQQAFTVVGPVPPGGMT